MICNSFPQNLRVARLMRHYSQQHMSNLLHICRQTYNHYETGRRRPDPDTILQISLILNISTDYLFTGDPLFLNIFYPEVQEFLKIFPSLPADTRQKVLDFAAQHVPEKTDPI